MAHFLQEIKKQIRNQNIKRKMASMENMKKDKEKLHKRYN